MDKDIQKRLERGREHYQNGEYDRAEPHLLKVADVEPRFADVMDMLGVIYHDRGQVGLAQEYFEKALRINPRYTEAALNLAVTYNEQGMYEEARQIHEHATSLRSDTQKEIEPFARGKLTNMHADLGAAYAEMQLLEPAIEQYHAALALSPQFADIRTRLGQLLKDAGRMREALSEFLHVTTERPDYVPAIISLGATYFAMKDNEQAREHWSRALDLDPQNRTAGMYLRMVDQMIAQEEARDSGVNIEVNPKTEGDNHRSGDGELEFSFEGERASVMPAAKNNDDSTES